MVMMGYQGFVVLFSSVDINMNFIEAFAALFKQEEFNFVSQLFYEYQYHLVTWFYLYLEMNL